MSKSNRPTPEFADGANIIAFPDPRTGVASEAPDMFPKPGEALIDHVRHQICGAILLIEVSVFNFRREVMSAVPQESMAEIEKSLAVIDELLRSARKSAQLIR